MSTLNNVLFSPTIIFSEWENVFYESPLYSFDSLNETYFIKNVFVNLSQLMGNTFNNYNYYVFASNWGQYLLPASALLETDKKKILIYISDESGYVPYYLSPYYYTIFKIHMQLNKFYVNNIFNFPLGCVKGVPELPIIPIAERKYSVFFSGNLNEGRLPMYYYLLFSKLPLAILQKCIKYILRKKIVSVKNILTSFRFDSKFQKAYIRFTNGFKQGISVEEYGKIIADSKIVLCPRGFQYTECFRHYEAMRAGCVIISEKLPPTFFYKDSPIIQISDWNEGLSIANELINNEMELERRSKMMIDWWKERCSENATAKYMIQCLETLNHASQ